MDPAGDTNAADSLMNFSLARAQARRRRFGVLAVLGYVALSWAVRLDMRFGEQIASLVYPLDTFSMYARIPAEEMSHLLIRDAQGAVHRVTDFRSFDCADPVTGRTARCSDRHGIQYLSEDLTNYIRQHAGPAGAEVEAEVDLIFRTWRVRAGEAPAQVSDCVVTRCKVAR
jgi:hypothetical protein